MGRDDADHNPAGGHGSSDAAGRGRARHAARVRRQTRRGPRPPVALGRAFGWLWAAYAVSTLGTWVAFDAFPLLAVLVLHAGPAQVSLLAAAAGAAGAVLAVPLGAGVERRAKRPVMVAADLVRCAAVLSVPVGYALGRLGLAQLLVVAVVTAAADTTFRAASGAYLKGLLRGPALLVASSRLESTTWAATAVGPPLGGAAVGLLGPVVTVVVNGVSFALSALGLRAIGPGEAAPDRTRSARLRPGDLLEGWRGLLRDPVLRPLLANTVAVNALILATAPLMAVLMLGQLRFAPWQYALAFGAPCVGGLLGARLSPHLVARYGRHAVLRRSGALRACWSLGLAAVVPGPVGLAVVLTVQLALVTCTGVFSPVLATYRLEQTPADRVTRTLSAWSITSSATVAATTALWGLLAALTSPRSAVALAGALLLLTPLLLPRRAAPSPASPAAAQR